MDRVDKIYLDAKIVDEFSLIAELFSYDVWDDGEIYKSAKTYMDEACTIVQCQANKYRSFEEFYICMRTYFPNTTISQAVNFLINYRPNKTARLYCNHCPDIRAITICYYQSRRSWEDVVYLDKYDSEYSWEELFNIANINKETYNKLIISK